MMEGRPRSRYIIRRQRGDSPRWTVRLIRCPICEKELGDPTTPGRTPVSGHIASHDPEDFGLSPMGERRAP